MSNIALEWILLDSDAPRDVREVALKTLLSEAEGMMEVHGFKLTKNEYQAIMVEPRKIPAIKLFRQFTGVGLKEAKEAIEQHFGK